MKVNPPLPMLPGEPLPAKRILVAGFIVKRAGVVVVQRSVFRDPIGDWRK